MGEPPISAETENSTVLRYNLESTEEGDLANGVKASTSEAEEVATRYQKSHGADTKPSPRLSSDSLLSDGSEDRGRSPPLVNGYHGFPGLPERKVSWRSKLWTFWLQNKGVFLVLLAQMFAAFMNVMTRLLERNGPHGEGMHTFQVG